MDRRHCIKPSFIATATSAGSSLFSVPALARITPKRVLALGGAQFLGPAIVEAAVAEGHIVTLFNRGIPNPDLFPHVEKLRGFRSRDAGGQDLSSLARRHFDAMGDAWPNDPTTGASAAEVLKDRVGQYLYVSTIAAYDSKELTSAGIEEDAPLEPWKSCSPCHRIRSSETKIGLSRSRVSAQFQSTLSKRQRKQRPMAKAQGPHSRER